MSIWMVEGAISRLFGMRIQEVVMTVTTTNAQIARTHMEPLLTVKDLESLFRVNRRTITRLCHMGQLPRPLKIGGSNRWKVKDIEHALMVLEDREQEEVIEVK